MRVFILIVQPQKPQYKQVILFNKLVFFINTAMQANVGLLSVELQCILCTEGSLRYSIRVISAISTNKAHELKTKERDHLITDKTIFLFEFLYLYVWCSKLIRYALISIYQREGVKKARRVPNHSTWNETMGLYT
jgi:hypothetical protein